MKITNNHNLPEPLYLRLKADEYDYIDDPKVYSATEVIGPPRITILRRRHRDEIVRDASQMFWRWQGSAIHNDLAKANVHASVQEERLFWEIGDGLKLSGKVDFLNTMRKIIDWKYTSVWSMIFDKPEWIAQPNVYTFLARKNGMAVDSASIWALFRDWKRSEMLRRHDYPPIAFQELEVDLWEDQTTENFIRVSIALLEKIKDRPDDALPLCTPQERWVRDDKWAVVKDGNKRAIRGGVFDTAVQAEDKLSTLPAGHFIEFRPGEDKRCNPDNCDVCEFCSYWKDKQDAEER